MNKNPAASASATQEAPGADTTNNEQVNANGAEQTNTNSTEAGAEQAAPEQTAQAEQAAPGGGNGEFIKTWMLRNLTLRNCAKWALNITLAVVMIASLEAYSVMINALDFAAWQGMIMKLSLGLLYLAGYFAITPAISKAVDYVADKAKAGWNKVKSWFAKSEEAAPVEAAPAPATA